MIRLHQTPIRDVRWQPKGDTPKPEYTCSGVLPDALGSQSAHNLPARGPGPPRRFCSFFGKKEHPFAPESAFFGKVGIHLPVRKPIPGFCPPKEAPRPFDPFAPNPQRDVRWQPKGDTPKPEYTCSGLFPDALGSQSAHNLPAGGPGPTPAFLLLFSEKGASLAPGSAFFEKWESICPLESPSPDFCPPERGAPPL